MRRLSRELNVNVLGYDYTGYGLSTGTKLGVRLERILFLA